MNDTMNPTRSIYRLALIFVQYFVFLSANDLEEGATGQLYKIDGKVTVPFQTEPDWITSTRVLIDGGQYLGFIKGDGTFSINNLPSGSYVIEITNPTYVFEPTRVDITSKGKIRARRVNNLQPNAVATVTYPLRFKARGKANYFQQREQWRITDFLFNPMILMMVLPFLMIMVLPKLINTSDPETQREMQQSMNFMNPKQNMPELSELMTSWFGGGSTAKKPIKSKPSRGSRRT